ncbi:hypothetical protein [Chryseobacterium bernardetii]|uniref:hypothetical protein n=1 Tax=Chryseobacterium bernardetii TaxID=1241978 RepID=UPI003AF6C0A9
MKNIFKTFILMFLIHINTYGQVGINTDKPNAYAGLHVSERKDPASANPDKYSGILIQRYTEEQRDAQLTPNMGASQNSLLIYNTTEDCYNYWNNADQEWKSLCGKLGKSQFTFDCAAIQVKGTYVQGRELTISNYLSIPVTVTKAGEYTFLATTANGYSFFASGTFFNTGSYTIQAAGQGTPVAVQTDNLAINANGIDVTCTPVRTVTVLSAAGSYTMSCGSAIVNGVYKVGTALTGSNTITLPVNVTSLGSYTVTTNTVDGISFSGSGTFTATGNQNITLNGTGTPNSTSTKTLTITSDSQGGISTSCNVNVIVVIPSKKILHIGNETVYGYSAFTGPSRSLMDSPTNFGTSASSIVKAEGYTHISLGTNPASDAALLTALNNKPDIVIIGFDNASLNTTQSGYLVDYLNKKGVVIAFQDRTDDIVSSNFLRAVFSNPALTVGYVGGGAGAVYPLTNANDPVLNGPFGDVRGKNWGEDSSTTVAVTSSISGIIPLSYAQPINSSTTYSGITAFRHSDLNLVWFGDGGFLSNENANGNQYPSNTIEPFVAPSSGGYLPVEKTAYGFAGNGRAAGSMQVQNSIVFANILAWAIKQAESNGINTK